MKDDTINSISRYEFELRKFIFLAFLSEFSKIIIFAFIFYSLDFFTEYWFSLFFLFLYRGNSGGIHCKHYTSCLLLSFAVLYSNVKLGLSIFLAKDIMLLISIICALICYLLTPVQAKTRPPASKELIKKAKYKTLLSILLFIVFLLLTKATIAVNLGFWMLILHTIQLIIAYYISRR